MKRYIVTLALLTSTALLTASAQIPAGKNRPASVPEGYVITPFGYFHPTCVQSIDSGETASGNASCSYPRYAPDGTPRPQASATAPTPEINGWIESTNIVAPKNRSFSAIYNSNIVPSSPSNDEGQTLFFFPGLEDVNDPNTSILQPVLAYYGGSWTVTNWNCCLNGITVHSTPFTTWPGHQIVSSTTENCKPGTLSCGNWNITSEDVDTGSSTTLLKTPSQGQVFNWAFGAVLEPYGVNNCNDYPDKPETYHMVVLDERLMPVVPHWSVSVNSTASPQCGYKIGAQPFKDTLHY